MYNWSLPVTNCINYFSKYFSGVFKNIFCVLQTLIELYWVASQCRQFYAPELKSTRNKQGLNQQLIQMELVESSPLLAPSTPQTPAPQQDNVTEESTSKTVSQPQKPAADRSSDSETLV